MLFNLHRMPKHVGNVLINIHMWTKSEFNSQLAWKGSKNYTLVCISQRKQNLIWAAAGEPEGLWCVYWQQDLHAKTHSYQASKLMDGVSENVYGKWWGGGGGVWGRSRQQVFVSRLINLLFYITCFLSKWKTCCELPGNHRPELLCRRTENIVSDDCFRCRLQSHHQQHNTAYIHTCTRSILYY